MYTVYKIIFPNNKYYIGITTNLRLRINAHKCRAKDINCNYLVYQAIRKYGFENLIWDVVEICDSLKDAELLEIKLIKELQPNYNLASGGMVHEMTEEIKLKISKANSGRILTQEHKDKTSKGLKEYYKDKEKAPKKESKRKYSEQACKNMKASRDKKREARIQLILSVYKDGMSLKELSSITKIPVRTIGMYTDEWRARFKDIKDNNNGI